MRLLTNLTFEACLVRLAWHIQLLSIGSIEEVVVLVEIVEMGYCVVGSSEVQLFIFVADWIQLGSLVKAAIAVGNKHTAEAFKGIGLIRYIGFFKLLIYLKVFLFQAIKE